MDRFESLALFGGSFDPIHLGHLHLAERAMDLVGLNHTRFIPCRVSPHKQDRPPTSSNHRVNMLRLATRNLSWASVDERELHRSGPSYSWMTAEEIHAENPNLRLFWIMGSDQWQSLSNWDQPLRLAACVEFIVFTRGFVPEPRKGFRLHTIDTPHPASATRIRDEIATGKHPHPWLPPAVADYILDHELYR